ncbi:oligosaccharyl transferase, archaeosortase A system-associated [Halorubrum sp. DTA98]|uniref:oligosaccharyl transferase, archaeosortase A system-associated n=1 Tax=Halorubrum sp. DTA98 TaxID=3402163 RepID=UPI003AAFC4BA
MSQQRDSSDGSGDSALDLLERWYHIPALLGIVVFMLWTRVQSYGNFIVDDDVYFRGNDAWYHYRETTYLLENFPSTMPFEAWTGFPVGRHVGQFGTLFDYIAAVGVLLASPIMGGEDGAMRTMLVIAPLLGTLVAIPTYLIARRFVDRFAAVAAVGVLALLPGTFFSYTLVGFFDHHAGEILFQTIAVLGFLVAFAVAEREKPVWELLVDRDWAALKRPTAYAAAAGVALGLYMWTWQPGVLMVGFTGIFLAVKITSDVYHGTSPEPIAFAGAVSMAVAGLMQIVPLDQFSFGVTDYSLTQVVLPLGVAVGAVFLAWLARQWEGRDLDADTYPAAVGGMVLASAGVVWLAIPSLWSTLTGSLLGTVGFSSGAGTRTIGEAQPPLQNTAFADFVLSQYGLAFFLALLAVLYILVRPLWRSEETNHTLYPVAALAVVGSVYAAPNLYEFLGGFVGVNWQVVGLLLATAFLVGATFLAQYDTEELYFVVWAAFIGSAAFTQTRFNYYLAVIVAIGAAYFLQLAIDALSLPSLDDVRDVEGWQVMTVAAVIAVLLIPLVAVATPVWAAGAGNGPGAVTEWDEGLQWMNEETPHPGELGGADNPMEYYGTYERPADGDFDYPEGAYGVQSWWDYGHWITTRAERIPNANPFQQGATEAANYLLAPSEERAAAVLDAQSDEGGDTRYVMVDWQMVSPTSKFGAPVTFYDDDDVTQDDFNEVVYQQTEEGALQPVMRTQTQRYYESQMVRLYEGYGSAMEPEPVVLDYDVERGTNPQTGEEFEIRTLPADPTAFVQRFDDMESAEAYVEEEGTARIGGVAGLPEERVDALEHYRLVHATESQGQAPAARHYQVLQSLGIDPAETVGTGLLEGFSDDWVKTFERVPGTTVEGSGAEPGEEVEATVEMAKPSGETFEYTQYAEADADGTFEFHLPYSTTGYDEYGPEEGYTNTSVRATGAYEITTEPTTDDDLYTTARVGAVDVTEGQVIGEDETTPTVELDEEVIDCPSGDPACPIGDANDDADDGSTDDDADGEESDTDGAETDADGEESDDEASLTTAASALAEPAA